MMNASKAGASPVPDLIYDVGMNDGDDAAFYLEQKYRVVAIEADPQLAAAAEKRFAREIEHGRLKILNVCIAERPEMVDFWICDEKPDWNSLNRAIASRLGMKHHAIKIRAVPFADILATHGVPHYLKIDIEGADMMCVHSLQSGTQPPFISLEAECVGDGSEPTEDQQVETLNVLRDLGYRKFKLIRQRDFHVFRWRAWERFGSRLANSLSRGRLAMLGLKWAAEPFTDHGFMRRVHGRTFRVGTSGPWGNYAPGHWLDYRQARETYLRERAVAMTVPGARSYEFWCDWHATL